MIEVCGQTDNGWNNRQHHAAKANGRADRITRHQASAVAEEQADTEHGGLRIVVPKRSEIERAQQNRIAVAADSIAAFPLLHLRVHQRESSTAPTIRKEKQYPEDGN